MPERSSGKHSIQRNEMTKSIEDLKTDFSEKKKKERNTEENSHRNEAGLEKPNRKCFLVTWMLLEYQNLRWF